MSNTADEIQKAEKQEKQEKQGTRTRDRSDSTEYKILLESAAGAASLV
jgi:hypothetical protein